MATSQVFIFSSDPLSASWHTFSNAYGLSARDTGKDNGNCVSTCLRKVFRQINWRIYMASPTLFWSVGIGFFLGFAFGVGCALAVMYSIYMGGYRAAIRDSQLPNPPERYRHAVGKLSGESSQ